MLPLYLFTVQILLNQWFIGVCISPVGNPLVDPSCSISCLWPHSTYGPRHLRNARYNDKGGKDEDDGDGDAEFVNGGGGSDNVVAGGGDQRHFRNAQLIFIGPGHSVFPSSQYHLRWLTFLSWGQKVQPLISCCVIGVKGFEGRKKLWRFQPYTFRQKSDQKLRLTGFSKLISCDDCCQKRSLLWLSKNLEMQFSYII